MTEEFQPNPDELLKAIQKDEDQKALGKLKIFFGMSAGVGKTYAMLGEARQRLNEGQKIIVGTVNTHGRKETEALLQGLPIIPEKWIKYKDTVFEEMDLEAILQYKPSLVIVDELAHTNIPGSRHPKRWQDVIELLDSGIDVYTTLNVQHIESRKDLIESFSGIQIRETVPDLILERANYIELVDLSPEELLQRLNEGKVYLGDQSAIAARNFFKEDTLTALREIALRLTAEKVDHDLHSILSQGKKWKTHEKLMVAISPSPTSQQLIRRTRRRAFELDAPWIAVYVDTGKTLSDTEQSLLTTHLNLAQELGAEVIATYDVNIASALQRIAKLKNITQLVMGRSVGTEWNLLRKSLLERVEQENQQLDLLILRQERQTKQYRRKSLSFTMRSKFYEHALATGLVIGLSILGFLLLPLIDYKSVGYIFLLGILLLGFFVGQGPVFFAALLSTLSWNYFFIPPNFAFSIQQPDDFALTIMYFCTAATIGMLISRKQKEEELLKLRENKLQNLYAIEGIIADSPNFAQLRRNLTARLQTIIQGNFDILTKQKDKDMLVFDSELPILTEEKEQAVAQWACQNGKLAGWSTSTLPAAKALYMPIGFADQTWGILCYHPERNRPLSIAEMNLLQIVVKNLGIYMERRM